MAKNDINILYTTVTGLGISKLQKDINKIDQKAFLVMSKVKDIKGGMIKKLPLKKLKETARIRLS